MMVGYEVNAIHRKWRFFFLILRLLHLKSIDFVEFPFAPFSSFIIVVCIVCNERLSRWTKEVKVYIFSSVCVYMLFPILYTKNSSAWSNTFLLCELLPWFAFNNANGRKGLAARAHNHFLCTQPPIFLLPPPPLTIPIIKRFYSVAIRNVITTSVRYGCVVLFGIIVPKYDIWSGIKMSALNKFANKVDNIKVSVR